MCQLSYTIQLGKHVEQQVHVFFDEGSQCEPPLSLTRPVNQVVCSHPFVYSVMWTTQLLANMSNTPHNLYIM